MKAQDFEYHRPKTRAAALSLMSERDAAPLAGGQSLMPMMNFRIAAPEALIDLNSIENLAGIKLADQSLIIGAMTRYATLETSALIAQNARLIAKALPHIAHPAIRNRGTIGGSCSLADPAAEMPAILLALGAEIELESAAGACRVAADDFFLGFYETARNEDELVVAIHIPLAPKRQRIGFYEITRRHGDYAMAGCAIVAVEDGSHTRIALFGVSDRPIRAKAAEAKMSGGAAIDAAIAALDEIKFAGDMNANATTKRHLAGVALRRAWAEMSS